jgi:hypothetical protein
MSSCCYPPQLTLMPTTSDGSKKRRRAADVVLAPVRAHALRQHLPHDRVVGLPVEVSTHLADFTDTTRPGYGPGIPGVAAGV